MSKSKIVDPKHEAALAARRARDKKARDHLDESYIRKLILKRFPYIGPDFPIPPGYITIRRLILAIRRKVWGRWTPEMDAAFKVHEDEYSREVRSKRRKGIDQ